VDFLIVDKEKIKLVVKEEDIPQIEGIKHLVLFS